MDAFWGVLPGIVVLVLVVAWAAGFTLYMNRKYLGRWW
jgi:uncharacterized membrane-anchored protein